MFFHRFLLHRSTGRLPAVSKDLSPAKVIALVINDTKCVEIFDGAEIEKKQWDFIHYFTIFKMIGIFEGTNPVLYRTLLVLYLSYPK